jgi:cation transport protein ChaC
MLSGGSCSGVAYRVRASGLDATFAQLWAREMPNEVYDPRWLRCRSVVEGHAREVQALAFTLDRRSPNYTGPIDDGEMLAILRSACGRYGTTLDYLLDTARSLRERCIRDREIERLVALAERHGLA